jgi:hypothetical protein
MASKYTPAYSRFVKRLEEVRTLLSAARATRNSGLTRPPTAAGFALVNALCRGGVVLLSSHIEGYIEDLGEIAIDQVAARGVAKSAVSAEFRYYVSRDIINEIKQAPPEKVAQRIEKLLNRDGHVWDSSPQFTYALSSNIFVSDFDNPTHKRICRFFRRFGYESFERDLAIRLRAQFPICTNMVDQVISQRNKIAHGDYALVIAPNDLTQMVSLVKTYCREADCAVGDWFRGIGCPIR